jgi:hypothetical protein
MLGNDATLEKWREKQYFQEAIKLMTCYGISILNLWDITQDKETDATWQILAWFASVNLGVTHPDRKLNTKAWCNQNQTSQQLQTIVNMFMYCHLKIIIIIASYVKWLICMLGYLN